MTLSLCVSYTVLRRLGMESSNSITGLSHAVLYLCSSNCSTWPGPQHEDSSRGCERRGDSLFSISSQWKKNRNIKSEIKSICVFSCLGCMCSITKMHGIWASFPKSMTSRGFAGENYFFSSVSSLWWHFGLNYWWRSQLLKERRAKLMENPHWDAQSSGNIMPSVLLEC